VNIAFVGPQGSGKSTLAAMLEQRRVHPYTVLPIAETIRTVAALGYGEDFDKGKHYSQRRMGLDIEVSGREILQDIGAQLRDLDASFWIKAWHAEYLKIKSANRLVVVDDVRLHHIPGIVIVRVHATAEARTQRRGVLQGVSDVTEFGYLQTEYDLQIDTTDLTAEDSYAILRKHMVNNGLWQSSYEEES
jgi:energy-coupling factor transporter ATP-binding protein EcfA2